MTDDRNNDASTPLMTPHDRDEAADPPQPVDTDAPGSTDGHGKPVDLPDRGGRID